ncbi:MAG TPA: DUF1003 domain-containing protein [Pararhizobium sp.]|nr:DUF1003 domain-containing protein [Pararhizobium sp.]
MPHILEQNIEAVRKKQAEQKAQEGAEERFAAFITSFASRMSFVYAHAVIVGLWIVVNIGWLPSIEFDPSFVILASAASVEAIFLSTFILISQRRAERLQDQRAELDVQIGLLTEREATEILLLLRPLAKKHGISVDDEDGPDLEEVVDPVRVLDELDGDPPDK